MSLFVCERCKTVDSMPLAYESVAGAPLLCTCCQGRPWHGYFPQQKYDPRKHAHVINHPALKID